MEDMNVHVLDHMAARYRIHDLMDDLLAEILYRLPNFPKTVTRCKSVCKRWRALVGNASFVPGFVRRQKEMNRKQLGGLITQHVDPRNGKTMCTISWGSEEESPVSLSLSFLPSTPGSIRVLAASRDLLLCCSVKDGLEDHSVYYICNPITKQWSHLETPGVLKYPRISFVWTGFVYDGEPARANSDGFTVVTMYAFKYDQRISLKSFSFKDGAWTRSTTVPPNCMPCSCPKDVAFVQCNGKLHYLTKSSVLALGLEPQAQGKCNWRLIQTLRDENDGDRTSKSLGVCGGRLRMSKSPSTFYFTISIWDLEYYEKSAWKLAYKVNLNLFSFHSQQPSAAAVRCFVEYFNPNNGDIVHVSYLIPPYYKYVMCDMKAKTLEFAPECETGFRFRSWFSIELPWWL